MCVNKRTGLPVCSVPGWSLIDFVSSSVGHWQAMRTQGLPVPEHRYSVAAAPN